MNDKVKGKEFGTPDQEILRHLEYIELQLDVITAFVRQILTDVTMPVPTGVVILQVNKGEAMAITGVQAGSATPNVFEADPIPSTVPFPAGTTDTWTSSDPAITVTPSSTNPSQVLVSCPATDTNASFVLSVSTQLPTPAGGTSPAPLTASVTVPIIPPAVPTGVTINQIS